MPEIKNDPLNRVLYIDLNKLSSEVVVRPDLFEVGPGWHWGRDPASGGTLPTRCGPFRPQKSHHSGGRPPCRSLPPGFKDGSIFQIPPHRQPG